MAVPADSTLCDDSFADLRTPEFGGGSVDRAREPDVATRLPRARLRGRVRLVVGAVLLTHLLLLAFSATRNSPTWDEVAHLPAGLSHWQWGRFELFAVNPPLVRMIGAIPLAIAGVELPWDAVDVSPAARHEFHMGAQFVARYGEDAFGWYVLGRWTCAAFSLLGACVCWHWARQLYGEAAGLMALSLWSLSPNILAHGSLIAPDCGAAALGVAASYLFWKWLKEPVWDRALGAGMVLGLAELTKTTWIVLFVLWPVLWVVWRAGGRRREDEEGGGREREEISGQRLGPNSGAGGGRRSWKVELAQLGVILLLGVYVLNVGYGFEGSFKRLGEYEFVSEMLGGPAADPVRAPLQFRNRFAATRAGQIPVPLPGNYVIGIDVQRSDFERKKWSYLGGEWRLGGWWYYYLYALAIKVPLGTWVLVLLAIGVGLLAPGYSSTNWRDELLLLAPIAVVLALVSSQTGFNHHLRYVLPIFPFAFIWMSKVARSVELSGSVVVRASRLHGAEGAGETPAPRGRLGHRVVAAVGALALCWSVGSSLWVYPHSLSYYNELVGGPKGGHYHLGSSNSDWGQDLFYLRHWLDEHPQARPLRVAYEMWLIDPKIAGIEHEGKPPRWAPEPGWHAISVNEIHCHQGYYEYFLRFEPVGMAGYSMYIYHLTPEEVNRVRRDLGVPELPDPHANPEEDGDGGIDEHAECDAPTS